MESGKGGKNSIRLAPINSGGIMAIRPVASPIDLLSQIIAYLHSKPSGAVTIAICTRREK